MRACDGCRSEMRVVDSYVALEGAEEVEVIRWRCQTCGEEGESTDRLLEVA
ncbi:MAG TPA: hypothetical protein VF097_08045 [Actinomycetota bacterium]